MSTAQPSSPKPQFASAELRVPSSRLSPLPSPRPIVNGFVPPSPRFASGPGGKPEGTSVSPVSCRVLTSLPGEGLDEWLEDLQKYEATLEAMAEASVDVKFKEELGTIEQCVVQSLSEAERTAALYTLLQHSNQGQIWFLIAVLQQMAGPGGANPLTAPLDASAKTKQSNRNLRPPSLNIPLPGSPATPQFNTPLSARPPAQSQVLEQAGQDVVVNRNDEGSWANMVNTPLVPMFQKAADGQNKNTEQTNMPMLNPAMFPQGMINPLMLNNMGLANVNEAQLSQLLAAQMMMMQSAQMGMQQPQHQKTQSPKPHHTNNWRSPASARYPGSALRSSGLKSSGLKSSGLKSASSLGSATTPREDEIDPELLKDVPAWLRSLRLHKYTASFEGMTWEEMVVLDEPTLEAKGIAALGARRRLLKTFDNVKKKMGMASESPDTPTPASALPGVTYTNGASESSPPSASELVAPHSAAP
ncbi:hypothetical protein B0H10DRAFT_2081228 [Mycena sp. CBHHK59/15]|nr:hypothetical protein B0H10DRAFT_2081228 [Mycena sp. CBHHK59/15]